MTIPESRTSLYTFIALMLLLIGLSAWVLLPYLLSLFMGGVLALLFTPWYQRLLRRGWGPRLSATVVTLAVVILVVGPISGFTTLAVRQGIGMAQRLSGRPQLSPQAVVRRLSPLGRWMGDPALIKRHLLNGVQGLARAVSAAVVGLAKNIPNILLQLILAIIACFFLLIDGKHFLYWTMNKIPMEHDVRLELIESFKDTAISTAWASLATSAVQTLFIVLGFLILGVPGAFIAGGISFILSWTPVIGTVPVWLSAAIYLFTQDRAAKAFGMIGVGVLIAVTDHLVRPWILKGRGDMHPLVSLVFIFGGIEAFGIFGVFVGPVLAAIVISLLDIWPLVGTRYGVTFGPKEGEG